VRALETRTEANKPVDTLRDVINRWRRRIGPALANTGAALLVGAGSAAAIFVFQPFGQRIWTAAPPLLILAGLILASRAARPRLDPARTARPLRFAVVRLAAKMITGALGCWLALIGWSSWSAGGATPPPKSRSEAIRVVTWNILHGTEHGPPWARFGWPARKVALENALEATAPDILCVQEALEEQVASLANVLPGCGHVGVGRDDGRSAGEYCAIFFDLTRFQQLDSGTFWLEEPNDLPPRNTLLGPKRICTWVRLRDNHSGRTIRVYNTHSYLSGRAQLNAARVILARIAASDPGDALLLTGDFNAPPGTPARLLLEKAGLVSSGSPWPDSSAASTYQFYGIRLKSLDEVLVDRQWHVESRRVLDMKPGNTYPSDHFGVMADVVLRDRSTPAGNAPKARIR
jgi:endonuclease/exonuclease/phosphatase family metal-dependent hydrolase